ncbi:MAG TPA: hypothetical protein VGZ33_06825 [Acidimicrobiales bacterium]|nr:hypothetical protein [Acidimicrobiales bacterium]
MSGAPEVWTLPELPGVLTSAEVADSGEHLAELQRDDGMIPWFEGGHCDPWNHVEAAMALSVCGRAREAEAAYAWLAATQLSDGSWFNYYLGDRVKDARIDTNVCAYPATGVWHHYCVTGDVAFLVERFGMVEAALDFVLRCQLADGTIRWSLDATGRSEGYALLTGSSSIFHALRCGVAAAEELGASRPDWELAAGRLGHAVAHHPGSFAPKNEYAMDWYYPVLCGALDGRAASARLDAGIATYVLEGLGVRCVSTNDWVTAAETAECAMALDALGRRDEALTVLAQTAAHRRGDGSYFTGLAYPSRTTFPGGETTSYTAAAVVLAADALSSTTPAAGLFRGERLAPALDLPAGHCRGAASLTCTAR